MFSFIAMAFGEDGEVPDSLIEFLEHENMRTTLAVIVSKTISNDIDREVLLIRSITTMIFHAINEYRCYKFINTPEMPSYFTEMMEELELSQELASAYKLLFSSFDDVLTFGSRFTILRMIEYVNSKWENHTEQSIDSPEYWSSSMTEFSRFDMARMEVIHAAFKLFVGFGFAYGKYRQGKNVLEIIDEPDPQWLAIYTDKIRGRVVEILDNENRGDEGISNETYDTSAFDSFISGLDTSRLGNNDD